MIRNKWLSIFAGVLAVAAACFLGIALYIFINPGSVSALLTVTSFRLLKSELEKLPPGISLTVLAPKYRDSPFVRGPLVILS